MQVRLLARQVTLERQGLALEKEIQDRTMSLTLRRGETFSDARNPDRAAIRPVLAP